MPSVLPTRSPSSSRSASPMATARSRTGFLPAMLIFMCMASTALYVNMDKRMSSLTYYFEGNLDRTFDVAPASTDNNNDKNEEGTRQLETPNNATTADSVTSGVNDPVSYGVNGFAPYAYMFLIGGIDPSKPGYRGFVYNVMIACDLLKRHGSKADFILFLQMSPDTEATELPEAEAKAVEEVGIQTVYMEKPETASFTDINMEKFRILSLTQYQRVLFLDADILPLVNMDYLMELSMGPRPLLQPNFVVATLGEPANGGCFMLSPQEGDYDALLQIVENQRISAKDLGYPFFDRWNGWGHNFKKHGDEWKGTRQSGQRWGWHGSHVDQGLLYYWTKYHKQSVTIFRGDIVENWVPGGEKQNNQPMLESSMDPSLIKKYAPPDEERIAYQFNCDRDRPDREGFFCKTPYYNYAHFSGGKKPWQQGYDAQKMKLTNHRMYNGAYRAWFNALFDLGKRLGWNITPENVDERFKAESPFGYLPNYGDFARRQQGANYTNKEGLPANTVTPVPAPTAAPKATEAPQSTPEPKPKEEEQPPEAEKPKEEEQTAAEGEKPKEAEQAAQAEKPKEAEQAAGGEAEVQANTEQETK